MSLQNIQAEFAELIFSKDEHTELFFPSENIVIYRNNIKSHLLQTLKNIYPMIFNLIGEAFFLQTADQYIDRYPSRSGNLHDYGEYFGEFLGECPALENLTYLPAVAKFEWVCHILHFAGDENNFNIKKLETIPPHQYDQLHFVLHPASCLMSFDCPLLHIIELCKGGRQEEIQLNNDVIYLLVIRREAGISLLNLSLTQFTFLSALNEGNTLKAALETTTLQQDKCFKLDELLTHWIKNKILVDCYI